MTLNNLYKPRKLINIISFQHFAVLCGFNSRAHSMDAEMCSATWRGVPMCEIVGSQSPWGAPEFPLVTPSYNHTVLYHIPSNGDMGDRPPKPQVGQEKWDSDHVRMPCSSKSLYPVKNGNGESELRKRWEMIEEALKKPILSSHQLADTILSYNTKFKAIWKFKAMHHLFNSYLEEEESQYFFTVTLPEIAKLALDLPKLIQAPIPLLKQNKTHSISLTQLQIASLLANAFFCTFPRRNTSKRNSEYSSYPHINFSNLYECDSYDDILEKLKCLCHYFRRVCTKAPLGVATFSRRGVPERACPQWTHSRELIATLPLHVDSEGTIENAHGLIQLDFANKYLGGGVLGHGSVQEEIRFVICPELMVSMLFTEVLRPTEALIMIGCERYSEHIGYARTFQWSGDYNDKTPYDSAGRRRVAVVAIDALPYASKTQEFRREMVTRDLNKAWVGFSFFSEDQVCMQYPGIATGNWGCGAFGGTPQLKSLIQIMACAQARRPMAYYTFGDTELRDEVINVYNLLARYNVTVGQLYQYILNFSLTDVIQSQLHSYLHQVLLDEGKSTRQRNSSPPPPMDTSASPKTVQETDKIQKELLDDSPDLFSQDEYQSLNESNQLSKSDVTPKQQQMADSNKMAPNNIMAPQTLRLFDELHKFDNDNGKLNLNVSYEKSETSIYFDVQKSDTLINTEKMDTKQTIIPSSSQIRSECDKLPENETRTGNTSRLFDEMEKFDEENGRLKLSTPNKTLMNSKNVAHDSDASMESDKSDLSVEIKKKITRKITDYFSKKSS